VECPRDCRVVDLAGSRLAATRYVGDLDLPHPGKGSLDQLDQVPLADRGVVEVEVYAEVRAPHRAQEGERVLGPCERGPRMVDGKVQVLQGEHNVALLAQVRDPGQRAL